MEGLALRAVRGIITGLIAGLITALILVVISALIPGISIDAGFWGLIVGILTALWVFLTGENGTRL